MLKLKVGTDAASDVARVRAAREAVGPDVAIRLDANQGWTPREAVRVIGALEDAHTDVELVEQPVRAEDLDGLAWVTARVGTPVMADEAVYGVRDLVEVIHRGRPTWSTSSSRSAAASGRPAPCSSSPARTTWAPSSAR